MHNWPAPGTSREVHLAVAEVTERIARRSRATRRAYLDRIDRRIDQEQRDGRPRAHAGCANLAHGVAACGADEKDLLARQSRPERGDRLRLQRHALGPPAARALPGAAQEGDPARRAVSHSSPAACRRCATASPRVAPAWNCRCSAAMSSRWRPRSRLHTTCSTPRCCSGVCDKIVPGLVIGALSFGHLPCIFVPGRADAVRHPQRREGPRARAARPGPGRRGEPCSSLRLNSYHAPGTCTFFGTANTNQLVMEAMGLHLPGASFVTSGTALRRALTEAAGRRIVELTRSGRARRCRADRRRASAGQRDGRAAGHRGLHQPHDAPGRDGGRGRHHAHLAGLRRALIGGAAAGAHLPERQRRHQRFPGRRRDRQPVPCAARRRASCTRTC